MERNINKKIDSHQVEFKNNIKDWLKTNGVVMKGKNNEDLTKSFLEFVFDFGKLELNKEDFQKRKRVKNAVPHCDLCIAKRANGEQCTRRRKDANSQYCGTHIKGTPHGEITNDPVTEKEPKSSKVEIWVQEIHGISYYIDNDNNVYRPEDIISNKPSPSIIAKWALVEGKYVIKGGFSQ